MSYGCNDQLLACFNRERNDRERDLNALQHEISELRRAVKNGRTNDADLVLFLDMSFESAGGEGTVQRQQFELLLTQDLSFASEVPPTNFFIQKIQAGSVRVDMRIIQDSSCRDALCVARDLEQQFSNPASKLRQGRLTAQLKSLSVCDMPPVTTSDAPERVIRAQCDEIEALKLTDAKMQHEVESLRRALTSGLKGSNQEAETLREELAAKEKDIEDLKSSLSIVSARNTTLQAQVDGYKQENDGVEGRLSELIGENESLLREKEALFHTVEQLQGEVESMKQDKGATAKTVDELNKRIQSEEAGFVALNQDRDALSRRFEKVCMLLFLSKPITL